ncbi:hypothetical protein ACFLZ8_05490 [Planctomycetota bacterium]
MKRIRNISLLLLILGMCCMVGCESLLGPKEPATDPNQVVDEYDFGFGEIDFAQDATGLPVADSTFIEEQPMLSSTTTYTSQGRDLVDVGEAGSSVVSRIYPWDECGIVQLDKEMPTEVGLDKPFNYTIKLTNLTDSLLSSIVIREEIPASFRYINSNPTAEEQQNLLLWEVTSLGPKASRQITVSGMADYAGTIQTSTTVITPVIPAIASVEVVEPRLTLSKIAPTEILLCDLMSVKYVVSNAGTGSIPNVRITDSLPQGLRTTDGKAELLFDAGTLRTGQTKEFTIELRPGRSGTYTSKAVATSTAGQRAESNETSTLVDLPLLNITTSGPEQVYIGRPVTYEISITNSSNAPARDAILENIIPDGVTDVKATAGAKLTETKLIWELETLEGNSTRTVRVSYVPTEAGQLTNTANATAYCSEPITSRAQTSVTGISAIMMEVVDLEDPIRIGNRATYMITVTNQGSAVAKNIRITCIIENNVQYVSSAGATASSVAGDTINFVPLGNLAPKDKAVWRVVVAAVRPGDVRFKVSMNSDDLGRPVEETEATHIYE